MTRPDEGLCLECELGHPCQVHDRTPPPPSTASRRGWLRRLVGRPRFPTPTRPDGPGGYPSSRRPASDLGRPPTGPAPGSAA